MFHYPMEDEFMMYRSPICGTSQPRHQKKQMVSGFEVKKYDSLNFVHPRKSRCHNHRASRIMVKPLSTPLIRRFFCTGGFLPVHVRRGRLRSALRSRIFRRGNGQFDSTKQMKLLSFTVLSQAN